MDSVNRLETAIFGGGCFWCLEAVFERVAGVVDVCPGYAGGRTDNPDYESVCSGETGHAEVVRLRFDPERVSYPTLLAVFFAIHDPTTRNRQGHDRGTQYRSVIVAQDATQHEQAHCAMTMLEADGVSPVVTELLAPEIRFFPAEAVHRGYYRLHPEVPYCRLVIAEKVARFCQTFGPLDRGAR